MPEDEPLLPWEIDHRQGCKDAEFFWHTQVTQTHGQAGPAGRNEAHQERKAFEAEDLRVGWTLRLLRMTVITRPLRFCWYSMPRSRVKKISKPDFSARSNNSPFFFPAKAASGTVQHSCPGRWFLSFLGRHSSSRTLIAVG